MTDHLLVSPVAARVAEHEGLDICTLKGSGPRGRIVKSDVLGAILHDGGDEKACKLEWLRLMLLIRHFEDAAQRAYQHSQIGGFLHLGIGEEAAIVGSVAAMDAKDYLIGAYRTHGFALARGCEPQVVMSELFGRADGCSGGRGGSMHTFDGARRYLGGYGIVGGQIPLGVGLALGASLQGTDEVTVCQLGDGASDGGPFAESLNMAALWHCPVVFLLTNNRYSMGTSLPRHSSVPELYRRGEPYGIEGMQCDGMDIEDTYRAMKEAIDKARNDRRPIILEVLTYRFRGHSVADPQRYRSKEEVEQWQEQDPISTFAAKLIADGLLDEASYNALGVAQEKVIEDAVGFADASPEPDVATLYDHLYVATDNSRGAAEMRPRDVAHPLLREKIKNA